VAVVVVFFSCYAPYQVQRLVFFYVEDVGLLEVINEYLYVISGDFVKIISTKKLVTKQKTSLFSENIKIRSLKYSDIYFQNFKVESD